MKILNLAGAAGALFLIAGVPALAASESDIATCKYRYERVREKVDRIIAKYGAESGHAYKAKEKLADVHEWCWRRYDGWWDENKKVWRTDHW